MKKSLLSIIIVVGIFILYPLPKPLFESSYSTVLEARNGELLSAQIAKDGQWRFPHGSSVPIKFETCIKYFEDEYFCGTPDVILEDTIVDIKSSWDCFSFPLFEDKINSKDYFYQLQVYMHLTGKRKAQLCYVLMNTPEDLTFDEPVDYTQIDSKYRIKTFDIDYDPEIIEKLQDKVILSRQYIKELI